jgi:hypothetical protein
MQSKYKRILLKLSGEVLAGAEGKGLDFDTVDKTAPMAKNRTDKIMLIYPASAGLAYFALSDATGDKKYFDAAMVIAEYYKENVLPSGSWYLMRSTETGEVEGDNVCASYQILDFMHEMYAKTGEEIWHTLEENYFKNLNAKDLSSIKLLYLKNCEQYMYQDAKEE